MTFIGNPPSASSLLQTLVKLLAEQEDVDIDYEIEENGKVVFSGSTKGGLITKEKKDGKQQKTCAGR